MSRVSIYHHRLLRTAIVGAIFGYEPIRRANEYISQNTTKPPIGIWHFNKRWLEVVDDANYFSPFLPELRFLCREALRGIVDIPLSCTFSPGSGVLHGALEVPEERVAKNIIAMRDAWARLRPREEIRPQMTRTAR